MPTRAAQALTGGGKWLFNYSSSLLVATAITGGLNAGVGRVLTLVSVSAGLTVLGRWAHGRQTASRSPARSQSAGSTRPPAYGTPPPALPRPRSAPVDGSVTTMYRLKVIPGTDRVDLVPLIEIRHDGTGREQPSGRREPSLRTEEGSIACAVEEQVNLG